MNRDDLERRERRWRRLILAVLASTLMGGCTSVHCSTEGKGGGPGGCGFDVKFSTTDDPTLPGSQGSQGETPPQPPPPPEN